MLSRVKSTLSGICLDSRDKSTLSGIRVGLGGTGGGQGHEEDAVELFELLDDDPDDKLTKCVVSPDDCGLRTMELEVPMPLTGELPEVNPSSAELDPLFPILVPGIPYSGLCILVHLDAEPLDVDDSQDVFMMDDGETPPPDDMSNGTVVWA